MENNNITIDHNTRNKKKAPIKPVHFLIIFVAISFIFAFLIGGYFVGKNTSKQEQQNSTEITEQVKLNAESIPENPDNWNEYALEELGISIKLPENLIKKGDWKEIKLENNIICFTYKELKNEDNCETDDLIVVASSNNSENNNFIFSKGFIEENGNYFLLDSSGKEVNISSEKFKTLETENNFKILKILGGESDISPDEKYLGAVINTNNDNYPALIILMEINGQVSEYEFDQILESLSPTN